jgi:hypothetical protein
MLTACAAAGKYKVSTKFQACSKNYFVFTQATKPKKAASTGGKVPDVPEVTIDN